MRTGASQTRMRTGAACSVILLAELVVAGLAGLAERAVVGADGAQIAAGRDGVELVRLAGQALGGGLELGRMGPDLGLGRGLHPGLGAAADREPGGDLRRELVDG